VPLNPFELHIICLIVLAGAALSLPAVVVRCSTLLVGMLVTLAKAPLGDRAGIFREFARAVSGAESHGPRCGQGSRSRLEARPPDDHAGEECRAVRRPRSPFERIRVLPARQCLIPAGSHAANQR
jgi:hypothetical protein